MLSARSFCRCYCCAHDERTKQKSKLLNTRLLQRALFAVAVLLACLPPAGVLAWSLSGPGKDKLSEQHGRYVLNRGFEDLYDSAFVLTNAGKGAPRVVSESELADALVDYDVVLFGEIHRHPGVHLQELRLLRSLYERNPRWILSFEQFERDVQGVVSDYVAGRIGERALIDKGRAWDNYLTSYRPLLSYAREHQLPVIAAEAPVWSIVCIGQFGPDILEQFTPTERSWVARDLHVTSDAYRDKYMQFQSGSATHGGGGATTPEAQLKSERSFTAQVARDDTMAESIVLARRQYPGRKVLHITGGFHAEGFLGTVTRLRLRDPTLKIAVIDAVEVTDRRAPGFASDLRTDATALQLVYPLPEEFVEGEDQSDFIRSISAKRKANPCRYTPPGATAAAAAATTVVPSATVPRAAPDSPVIEHALQVRLHPAAHRLEVHDRLKIPAVLVDHDFSFLLNADLKVRSTSPGLRLAIVKRRVLAGAVGMDREDHDPNNPVRVNVYRVLGVREHSDLALDLAYEGVIDNPIREQGQAYARGFSETPGIIEERGVYLARSSHWVPEAHGTLLRYRLHTDLPAGWKSVSQGLRGEDSSTGPHTSPDRVHEVWEVATPTEQVHLIAARFTEYPRDAGAVKAYAFLRTPDEALAARYLTATAQYLKMYDGLFGQYPYGKFALVENFWETGYGMPSFTLLGPQIIRFPFILTSSYPHELLHNWWGNGVFVDFTGGNWCEGLTAYLADHLLAEQRGQGAVHRRDILQRVTDFVTPENDFPLTQFRSRYDAVTEAIGYGKTAMVWNMLRERVGDAPFLASLKTFYRDNQFRAASFDDIRRSFEAVTGRDLGPFFKEWVTQKGLPELRLDQATRSGNDVTVRLAQAQAPPWFALDVPVAIYTASGVQLRSIVMTADQPTATGSFTLPSPVTRVDIDPQFQVYRRLSPLETPPALSKAFGASQVLIVVPAADAGTSYAGFVKAWSRTGVEVVDDRSLSSLPHDRPVWIIGSNNRYAAAVSQALGIYGAALDAGALRLADTTYAAGAKSIVVAVRNPENPATVLVYVSAPTAAAAEGLARKLPHYGKYSWLIFQGDAPDNEAKGEWPASQSPLVQVFQSQPAALPALPVRPALAELPPQFDAGRLKADVEWLADSAREGRGIGTRGLDESANYVADAFRRIGLKPLRPSGDYFQNFAVNGPDGKQAAVRNVIGVLPGSNTAYAHQSVLISAHYDHLGRGWPDVHSGDEGKLHPGADDNASGVAVLLELARTLADSHPERSIIFAAFTGEEEGLLGSREYVRRAKGPDDPWPLGGVMADLNLDTVGRLETGKLTVLGADSAREWPFIFNGITATMGIPITVVTKAVDASDHTAFVEAGIPAVQLFASTAVDYHRPSDTAAKIDVVGLVTVATALKEAADYLASRPDPLHYTGAAAALPVVAARAPDAAQGAPKRAATGIVPDMTYEGVGVRAASIAVGSGADKAGLQTGDRVLAIAGTRTPDLKALAGALQQLHPGETVEVEFARDQKTLKAQLTLGER